MDEPTVILNADARNGSPFLSAASAVGKSFVIEEWSGSGPDYLHVHHADDEAWHILEGRLTFRFRNEEVEASAGTTVFVPAGVPHSYYETSGPTRYLIIMTPRLRHLISALHSAPVEQHRTIMNTFDSAILD